VVYFKFLKLQVAFLALDLSSTIYWLCDLGQVT
jgi:hypothetical protein